MSRLDGILGAVGKTCETLNRAVAGCARFGDGGWAGDPADYVPPPLEPWQQAKRQGEHDGMCDYCDPKVRFCKLRRSGDRFYEHELVSDCGIVHTTVAVDWLEERRTFQQDKDGEKGKDHTRTSELKFFGLTVEERKHFTEILGEEVNQLLRAQHAEQVALAKERQQPPPRPPPKITEFALNKINQRLNQSGGWFKRMQDDKPGQFFLTNLEIKTCLIALRAACVQWGVDFATVNHTGSPILWAIALALEMYARRENGFSVTSKELQRQVTFDGLHELLSQFKGDSFKSDESEELATSIKGRKNKEAREAARETVKTKYRKARSDELGATPAQRAAKVATLSQLLGRSNVWDGEVLSKPVRALDAPALVDLKLRPAIAVMEVRPRQRELSSFESYYASRPDTAGLEKPVVRYVPGSDAEPAPAPETVTEALTDEQLLDQLEEPPDDFSLDDDARPSVEAAVPLPEGEGEGESESEGESETTASEMGESELGEAPDDLDVDDDCWEAAQEAAKSETLAVAPAPAPAPEAAPSLKRKKRPYIDAHRVKKATAREVLGSSNFEKHGQVFWDQWKRESLEWREKCREREARQDAKLKSEMDKKAKKAAERLAKDKKAAEKAAEKREERGWNQLMSQGAKKEKAEERLARGKGTSYVVPTEETNDKATGTLAKIRINQVLPRIKIPAAMLKDLEPPKPEEEAEIEVGEVKAVRIKLASSARPLQRALPAKRKAPEEEEAAAAAGADPYARTFKPRRRAARSFEAASVSDASEAVPEEIDLPEAHSSSAASDAESEAKPPGALTAASASCAAASPVASPSPL